MTPLVDPMTTLAVSMHATERGYALLLGSGVSRAARIPTGWEVVVDLVRKLATAMGESAEPKPDKWYSDKFGMAPGYTTVLRQVATRAADRQAILAKYFEPTDEERARGEKQPTAAHRAIARMVRAKHIAIIITTNFDRLMERALEDEGMPPTVIASGPAFSGSHPFQRNACTVIKVHGDYQDTRLKNTEDEVATYPAKQTAALRRIFDEYGLVICGWSGEWDVALRDALEARTSRRYACYWFGVGPLPACAKGLTQRLGAEVVQTQGADAAFAELEEKVGALRRLSSPHPLSAAMSADSVKEYIAEDRHRVRLHDLVQGATEQARDAVRKIAQASVAEPNVNAETLAATLGRYESAAEVLATTLMTGAYWNHERIAERLWTQPVRRLAGAVDSLADGRVEWHDLTIYPASLLMYAVGVASITRLDYTLLGELLSKTEITRNQRTYPCAMQLPLVFNWDPRKHLPHDRFPLLSRARAFIRRISASLIVDDDEFDRAYARFEYFLGFAISWQREALELALTPGWGPPALYWLNGRWGPPPLLDEMEKEREQFHHQWLPRRHGVIEGEAEAIAAAQARHHDFVRMAKSALV